MSTYNKVFYEEMAKIIFQLSSNIIKYTLNLFFCVWVHIRSASSRCFKLAPTMYEPHSEKTGLWGFRPGPTQTGLYSYRRWMTRGLKIRI